MKILICGGEGQLARAFAAHLLRAYPLVEMCAPSHEELDVSSAGQVNNALRTFRPDIVINTAAYHKVDECESNSTRAFEVNAWGGYAVAKASKEIGARSLYISTGYVFDGEKSDPYEESDTPHPLNVYGHSKALAEKLILSVDPSALIVRTNGLFGEYANSRTKGGAGNFVDFVAREAREGNNIAMVNDQRVAPTHTNDLAKACAKLLIEYPHGGIFHLTNDGDTTWFGIASFIYNLLDSRGALTPLTTAERNASAVRPRNALLANNRWRVLGNAALPHWEDAVALYLKNNHAG